MTKLYRDLCSDSVWLLDDTSNKQQRYIDLCRLKEYDISRPANP